MSPRARATADATTSSSSPLDDDNSLSEPLLPDDDDNDFANAESSAEEEPVAQQPRISRNVPIALAYTAFVFAGRSVWSQSVLSTFVFLIRQEDYRAVGFITAVMGLAQLVTSLPVGYLADRYRRDTLLRVASVVALAAIVATLYAIYTNNYRALVVGLAVWGVYYGIANTALSALFADSIPTGKRSKYFTHRSLLVNLGFGVGPVVSLIMFAALGDTWGIRDCAIVLAVGQFICLPAVVLLCFLSDDHVVPHEEEEQGDNNNSDDAADNNDDRVSTLTRDVLTADYGGDADESHQGRFNNNNIVDSCLWRVFGFLRSRRIAVLIAIADLISGLASGMSIRYFPIFFAENLHMKPVKVQILYALTPVIMASCMKLGQSLSRRFGRCRVSVVFKWIGVSLMWTMVISYKRNLPRWLVCTIYILRTAFMNSTGALTRSVLMDHVPAAERGRWAALESLNMFSWSGSAALGGYLVGMIGMVPLFCATAFVQFLGTFPLIRLSLEEKLEGHQSEQPATSNNLSRPLLTSSESQQRRRGSV